VENNEKAFLETKSNNPRVCTKNSEFSLCYRKSPGTVGAVVGEKLLQRTIPLPQLRVRVILALNGPTAIAIVAVHYQQ
jgi:hypothetical protein